MLMKTLMKNNNQCNNNLNLLIQDRLYAMGRIKPKEKKWRVNGQNILIYIPTNQKVGDVITKSLDNASFIAIRK